MYIQFIAPLGTNKLISKEKLITQRREAVQYKWAFKTLALLFLTLLRKYITEINRWYCILNFSSDEDKPMATHSGDYP